MYGGPLKLISAEQATRPRVFDFIEALDAAGSEAKRAVDPIRPNDRSRDRVTTRQRTGGPTR